jgi:hypothetical protein
MHNPSMMKNALLSFVLPPIKSKINISLWQKYASVINQFLHLLPLFKKITTSRKLLVQERHHSGRRDCSQ